MPEVVDADEETRSALAPDPRFLTHERLVAIWQGGSASAPLPQIGSLVVGRGSNAGLRVATAAVSREHAVIHSGVPCQIEDLGSSNGTRVDGKKLAPRERAPLLSGSLVELGDALLLVQPPPQPSATGPIASDDAMQRLGRLITRVADSDLPVILHGETGVGKEVTAARIHEQSRRRGMPYLKINCAAFAESMVESELFGHERGAFTGAQQSKVGLLEAARGGTVLLDEVTELTLPIQAKLLRALGNAEILRLGSTKPTPIDLRFIAATNQDFGTLIASGKFRADLYFRLNGITLDIPPLRARTAEIVPLALQFLEALAKRSGEPPIRLSSAASAWLVRYPFPGNVRELKNLIERAAVLAAPQPIGVEHLVPDAAFEERASRPQTALPAPSAATSSSSPLAAEPPSENPVELKQQLKGLERDRIIEAIGKTGGNQTLAAKLLGISRRALLHRLDEYGLPRPRKGRGD
jgi:DNA-binding NtrC family response regulator